MTQTTAVSFGIATAPQQVTYHEVQRVWREADSIPEIEHAWLFDHLLPIAGDQRGPIFEGGRCCPPSPRRPSDFDSGCW